MGLTPVSLVLFTIFCVNKITGDVIVDTKSGKISGLEVKSIFPDEKYYSFLSIPYAQPPIGKLRFRVSFSSSIVHY